MTFRVVSIFPVEKNDDRDTKPLVPGRMFHGHPHVVLNVPSCTRATLMLCGRWCGTNWDGRVGA